MKRLNTLLTIHDDSQHSKAHRKIIQCPSCGAKYGVSGHIVDYVCPKCKTLKEFNVKKWTSATGLEHNYWRRKYKSDEYFGATAKPRNKTEKIQDDT